MATQLISPNEALETSPGGETSVLISGGGAPRLHIANTLIPTLFNDVAEGVRALPRGGAEIGGLLVGPKNHEGGILADEMIPIPIEYRFGPSFRLSSPDLTKIEDAIAATHKDPSKTVVGFFRSRTRGGAEFRDSDQEILLAVELAHAGFAEDFHFYLVFSPPARSEMPLGLSVRKGSEWGDFRPFTCHNDLPGITSDLGDPEPEEVPSPSEAPVHMPEHEPAMASAIETAQPEASGHENMATVIAAETHNHESAPEAAAANQPEPVHTDPETLMTSTETITAETEALSGDIHDPAKADLEALSGNGHTSAKTKTGAKKTKTAAKSETTPRPRAKKAASTTAKSKTARAAAASTEPATPEAKDTKETKEIKVTKAKHHAHTTPSAETHEPVPVMTAETADADAQFYSKMKPLAGPSPWDQLIARIPRQHMMWAAGVVAAAALGTSTYFLFPKHTATHESAPVAVAAAAPAPVAKKTLALTAERHGSDLVLSWNRESPSIAGASYGMLIIRGKDGRRDIALTPEQLRAGSIVYTPTTDQVQVELSVVAGEQVTKDSVIVFLPRKEKGAIVTSA